jgi:hypothetical protein
VSVDPIVLGVPGAVATSAASATSASSSATPAATAGQPAPLAQQLARPLFTLAAAGPGVHVVTVDVAPEALGPVTVRAHVSAHGTHVEMFAASDAGRDAVRAILGDLRRDLATAANTAGANPGGAGYQTSVDLSSQNQPSDPRGDRSGQLAAQAGADGGPGRQARDTTEARAADARTGRALRDATDPLDATGAVDRARASSSLSTSIDVLA